MSNLNITAFTEMNPYTRDGIADRLNLKRFRDDRDDEQIRALVGAQAYNDTMEHQIAAYWGMSVEKLRALINAVNQAGGPGAVANPVVQQVFIEDDTKIRTLRLERSNLEVELTKAKRALRVARTAVDEAEYMLKSMKNTIKAKGMDTATLNRNLEDVIERLGRNLDADQQKPLPTMVEEE